MSTKSLGVLSLGYWFGAHSLGLLLHPYQSMRRVVRERVFVPLVLEPLVFLGVWWGLGVVVAHFTVLEKLGLLKMSVVLESVWLTRPVMYFGFVWGGVFLVLWQVMLFYLWWRFKGIIE